MPPARNAAYASCRQGKRCAVRPLERQLTDRSQVERRGAGFDPFRIAERMRDRDPHVGVGKLRDHRAVDEFHQRVDDALGMDQHFDTLGRHYRTASEPLLLRGPCSSWSRNRPRSCAPWSSWDGRRPRSGVTHGRTLDRRRPLKGPPRSSEQDTKRRTSACGEPRPERQALEHGVVLAVDRQQSRAAKSRIARDEKGPRHHQCFLVGEQDALAGARARPATGASPAAPTIAAISTSHSGSVATCSSA